MQKILQIDLEKKKSFREFQKSSFIRIRWNNAFKFKRTSFGF